MGKLSLQDVVRRLRLDLSQSVAEGRDETVRFEVGPIEVELLVEFEREAGGGSKINAWVLELSAEGKLKETQGHRIKFTLQPLSEGVEGGRLLIGGRQHGRPD